MAIEISSARKKPQSVTGGVDISGFPQRLLTREFGDPDTLLLPLLRSAREAIEAGKSLMASGQGASQANMMASIHLATALLKDSNFSLSSKGSQTQNDYVVDLENKTILLKTWLFATINKRTSTFLVRISGSLETGLFTVRGSDEGVMAEFDEQRMAESGFFANRLAEECLRLQMSKDHFKRFGDMPTLQGEVGLRVQLPAANGVVPVTLKKKPDSETWELVDEQTSRGLGTLPAEAAGQLEQLLKAMAALVKKQG
jgi:hypothetical protein